MHGCDDLVPSVLRIFGDEDVGGARRESRVFEEVARALARAKLYISRCSIEGEGSDARDGYQQSRCRHNIDDIALGSGEFL